MAMNANDALNLLQSMFETWDRDSLITVLQMNHGHVERTIEMILKMNGDTATTPNDSKTETENPISQNSSPTSIPEPHNTLKNKVPTSSTATPPRQSARQSPQKISQVEIDQLLANQLSMDSNNPYLTTTSSAVKNAIADANEDLNSNSLPSVKLRQRNHSQSVQRHQGRGTFIDLPDEYLRLPYSIHERLCIHRGDITPLERRKQTQLKIGKKKLQRSINNISSREQHDMELAMAVQDELLTQQIAEDEARQSSFGGMIGGLVGDALGEVDARWTLQQRQRQLQQQRQQQQQGRLEAEEGFSLSKVSSFFSTVGEDAKRKLNEVAGKIQAATGTGGYAMNDGTSCGIMEGDEDEGEGHQLRRGDRQLTHRSAQLETNTTSSDRRRQQRPNFNGGVGQLPTRRKDD